MSNTTPLSAANLATDARGLVLPPDGYHELLAELLTTLAAELLDQGLAPAAANDIAWRTTELIRDRWGGQAVYIAQGVGFETLRRYQQIWDEFTGNNVPELARKFDLSEVAIYQALRYMREKDRRDRQGDLFGAEKAA